MGKIIAKMLSSKCRRIKDIARFLLPNIKAFFDSDEGRAEFEKWKTEQNCQKATSEKMEKSGEKSPL